MFEYLGILLPTLLLGARNTLLIFTLTLIFALPLGLVFTLASISKIPPLRWLSNTYIWIMRGTPLMLQLFFMYFFIPIVTKQGLMLSNLSTAAITFILNYAAYFAEIYRGGIQSIDKGQYEAAKTLGFSYHKTMWHIIIPQTVGRVLPPIANEAITLVKDTALIHVIGAAEIMYYARSAVNTSVNPTPYAVAACFYLLFTFVLTVLAKKLENRFARHEKV